MRTSYEIVDRNITHALRIVSARESWTYEISHSHRGRRISGINYNFVRLPSRRDQPIAFAGRRSCFHFLSVFGMFGFETHETLRDLLMSKQSR